MKVRPQSSRLDKRKKNSALTLEQGEEAVTMDAQNSTVSEPADCHQEISDFENYTPEKWWQLFTQMNTTLQAVNNKLTTLEGKQISDVSSLETTQLALANRVNSLEETVRNNGIQQRIMMNIIIHQDEQIQKLQLEALAAKRDKINNNIVLDGLLEEDKETPQSLRTRIVHFFENTMSIPKETCDSLKFSEAYHQGVKGRQE